MSIRFLQAVWDVFLTNLVLTCWQRRSRILHGLLEHVNDVCHQTNLSDGVVRKGLSRFLGTPTSRSARRVPLAHRTGSFVDLVMKTQQPFKQGFEEAVYPSIL
jgi:hypothetical protein